MTADACIGPDRAPDRYANAIKVRDPGKPRYPYRIENAAQETDGIGCRSQAIRVLVRIGPPAQRRNVVGEPSRQAFRFEHIASDATAQPTRPTGG
jgi:hypothetical protein